LVFCAKKNLATLLLRVVKRVTRLADCLLWADFSATPYHGIKVIHKLGWAKFWAICSQTHLVTLVVVK
jgi:hypothetical protein